MSTGCHRCHTVALDTAGNGDLDASEFVDGCMRLKGPARSIDVSLLLQEQRRMRKKITGWTPTRALVGGHVWHHGSLIWGWFSLFSGLEQLLLDWRCEIEQRASKRFSMNSRDPREDLERMEEIGV
eukprot:Skav230362  [mRNA]  locus=scaffold291:60687:61064:- [translate_table: standard]